MPSKSAAQEIYIDYDTERFIEGEAFDYEEAAKVHAEFCRIREERMKTKLKCCYRCKVEKPISEFHRSKARKDGVECYCCDCRREYTRIWACANHQKIQQRRWRTLSKLENKITLLYSVARTRAKKKNVPFEISKSDLLEQWSKQKGKCYYTDIILGNSNGHGRQLDNLSIDRIEPCVGYVKGNVVFCANIVNRMKLDCSIDEFLGWVSAIHKNRRRIRNVSTAIRGHT